MISLTEAQRYVLDSLTPLAPEVLPLGQALGCVAVGDTYAIEAVPGFTNSSMDGFALRSADTHDGVAQLRVLGSVLAGDGPALQLGVGDAARIMTGAPLPDGADSVCMLEEVSFDSANQTVTIERKILAGEYVRHPGEDVEIGQLLVSSGDVLHATRLAVLASQGVTSVLAIRQLRVGVLSTGNELARATGPLQSGQIRDLNRPLLLSLLHESGCTAVDLGIVSDNHAHITQRLRDASSDCDAVISTGGVSVGDVDHVKLVIGELGGESARWMQVAIKPGKPFAFGVVGDRRVPLFGLPGNPVSTRVSFELFVRPALRRLAGYHRLERLILNAVLECPLPRTRDGKLHLVHAVARVHEDGLVHVERIIRHGSHLLSAIVEANVLVMVPDGDSPSKGDVARVMVLDADELSGVTR